MIKLLALDVDGTLTDGKIIYSDSLEIKAFDVKDGLAIASWHRMGRKSAIITGRTSEVVNKRAGELGCHYILQGVKDKGAALRDIIAQEGLEACEVAAIGDDINDIKMFEAAGKSYAPSDCSEHIYKYVSLLKNSGGNGAVREMVELILKKEHLLEQFIENFTK